MNITIFVINNYKAKFFIRVANYLTLKHSITFLTTSFSSYLLIKKTPHKVHMLQSFISDKVNFEEIIQYREEAIFLDVQAGFLSLESANSQFNNLSKGFMNYFLKNEVDRLFLWNGSRLSGYVAVLLSNKLKIKKLVFEVGNFPNKLFIDNVGVNAKSSLMHANIYKSINYSQPKLINYLNIHKQEKEKNHVVQQALNNNINIFILLDYFHNAFSKYHLTENSSTLIKRIKAKLQKRKKLKYDKINFKEISYFFFPLQVSTDSQVLRNSKISLKRAIDIAVEDSIKNNRMLVIKPHPAENNIEIYNYILIIKKRKGNVFIVKYNTYQLIKFSKKVITINSTVGIEALMYYKPVFVLGNTFYKKYCTNSELIHIDRTPINHFLYYYFFEFLNDGDFFGNSAIKFNDDLLLENDAL